MAVEGVTTTKDGFEELVTDLERCIVGLMEVCGSEESQCRVAMEVLVCRVIVSWGEQVEVGEKGEVGGLFWRE